MRPSLLIGLLFAAGFALAAGCAWWPSNSSSDCYVTRAAPARMFALEAPATASANATFSVTPYVVLSAPVVKIDELLPETFQATVDAAARTITVTGSVRRTDKNPMAHCTYPLLAVVPQVSTLSLEVAVPSGSYELRIPAGQFDAEPPAQVGNPPRDLPAAMSSRSIEIQ